MAKRYKKLIVFFNASVILAGLRSPKGGSGKLISWVKKSKIKGVISELILDEARRNLDKLAIRKAQLNRITANFLIILSPSSSLVDKFKRLVVDHGDAHVFASAMEAKSDYLVSLDKKHILSLKSKIKNFIIVSPKELIETLCLCRGRGSNPHEVLSS